jgi:hypothetical protein
VNGAGLGAAGRSVPLGDGLETTGRSVSLAFEFGAEAGAASFGLGETVSDERGRHRPATSANPLAQKKRGWQFPAASARRPSGQIVRSKQRPLASGERPSAQVRAGQ